MRFIASRDGYIHFVANDPQAAIAAAGGNVRAAMVHAESVANYHGPLEIVDLDAPADVHVVIYERPGTG